jgi:hypothetical protein
MQLSETTIRLLANDFNCPEADKVYDEAINKAHEFYSTVWFDPTENKPLNTPPLFLKFYAFDGSVFCGWEVK